MWYCGNTASYGQPGYGAKPVGGKLPNGFGLYDMSGNLREWCEDDWYLNYTVCAGGWQLVGGVATGLGPGGT